MNRTPDGILVATAMKIIKAHPGGISRQGMVDMLRARNIGAEFSDNTLDRRNREAIEYLRKHDPDGAYIIYDPRGGYRMAENAEELGHYLKTERGRGLDILEKVSAQAKRAGVVLQGQEAYG